MTFDLASLKNEAVATGVVHLLHPKTGEDTGAKITVHSPDSAQYRKAANQVKNRNMALLRKGSKSISAEAIDAGAMDILVAAVVSWEGIEWGGQPMECTEANVRELFAVFPSFKEQVDEFLGDRGNFYSS